MTPAQSLQGIIGSLDGACATDDDIRLLKSRLPAELTPDWLIDILRKYRLSGAYFDLPAMHDKSGLGADLVWLTPGQIMSESFDVEPGLSVVCLRFLPIGGCSTGSGDPYFLDFRQVSDDPPLVRIPHDYAGGEFYPLDRVELVSPSLSEFISKSRPL